MPFFHYAGGRLDRAAVLRRDDAWLSEMLVRRDALIVPVWRDRNLVRHSRDGGVVATRCDMRVFRERLAPPAAPRAAPTAPDAIDGGGWVFLGLDGAVPVFAADLSALDEAHALITAWAPDESFVDLRRVGGAASMDDAALMAYARGMLTWHRRQQYCGSCGGPTRSGQGGHVRICTSPECGAHIFPRTDPAVIMLVERPATAGEPARCLLARHARSPRGAHSTLAGFVEPGESLEEAVAREVMEETGVRVGAVSYRGSQPWPFPSSLMIGFRARADSVRIEVDPEELAEAHWFTAADLARFGEWDDDGAEYRLPRRDSIARALVNDWLGEQRGDG